MRIRVTQDHIDRGTRGMSDRCPIALAIQEQCSETALVGSDVLFPRTRAYRSLPPEATEFIHRFDDRKSVEPFEFDLECPT